MPRFRPPTIPATIEDVKGAVEKLARHAGGIAPGKLPEAVTGQARDRMAAFVGVSGRTLEKAEAVVAAAEAEPEKFGKLAADIEIR